VLNREQWCDVPLERQLHRHRPTAMLCSSDAIRFYTRWTCIALIKLHYWQSTNNARGITLVTKMHGATRSQLLKDTKQKDAIAISVVLGRKSYQFRTLHGRGNVCVHKYNGKRFLCQSRQKEETRLLGIHCIYTARHLPTWRGKTCVGFQELQHCMVDFFNLSSHILRGRRSRLLRRQTRRSSQFSYVHGVLIQRSSTFLRY